MNCMFDPDIAPYSLIATTVTDQMKAAMCRDSKNGNVVVNHHFGDYLREFLLFAQIFNTKRKQFVIDLLFQVNSFPENS